MWLVWLFETEIFPPFSKKITGLAIRPFLEMYLRLHFGHCMSPQYEIRFVLMEYSFLPHEQKNEM